MIDLSTIMSFRIDDMEKPHKSAVSIEAQQASTKPCKNCDCGAVIVKKKPWWKRWF